MKSGLLPGIQPGKGGHYFIAGPVTNYRVQKIRRVIQEQQRTQKQRSGETRKHAIKGPANSRAAGVATIEGVRALFDIWLRQVGDDWTKWDAKRQALLMDEIMPIYLVGEWLRENRQRINSPRPRP